MPGFDGPGIHLEHLHRYYLAATMVEGAILDLGCGVGYGSRLLAKRARTVLGVDISIATIDLARTSFGGARVRFVTADALALPIATGAMDWVVCFELIEHLREAEEVVAEIARVLAPDGQLLLSTPNRPVYSEARGYANPFHVRELDEAELRDLLAAEFHDVALVGQRLIAASTAWQLNRHDEDVALQLEPDSELAPGLVTDREPTYLLALCRRRRGRRRRAMARSILPGRLESFAEEQAALRRASEAAIRATYEEVVERLVVQLSEFDTRVRQLGNELDSRRDWRPVAEEPEVAQERARAEAAEADVRRFAAERTALREQLGELTDALSEAHDQHVALKQRTLDLEGELERRSSNLHSKEREIEDALGDLVRTRAERDAAKRALGRSKEKIARLRATLGSATEQLQRTNDEMGRVRADLDWCYRHWQSREAELAAIHGSKTWRLWMAYLAVRRALSSLWRDPGLALRWPGAPKALLAGPRRAWRWLRLAGWTVGALIAGRLRGSGLAGGAPVVRELVDHAPASLRWRPRILLVSPYQLYPADHGGAVRIFNLVKRLSRDCDLHLLIFSLEGDDAAQREALAPWVKSLQFHQWQPRLRSDLCGVESPAAQLFAAPEVHSKIDEILARQRIDILQLEYTELGQYGLLPRARAKVVLTEIDIAFRSSARRRRVRMHQRYELGRVFGYSLWDWMLQFRYELKVTRRADQVHVMSTEDGQFLARFLPGSADRIRIVPNAVDIGSYTPPPASAPRGSRLLFLGNFEHLPNLDALDFLLRDVWPLVRRRHPDAALDVVGARAGETVRRYDGRDGVTVVGAVAETKSYYQSCRALVAAIRAGSGTRLKILEALACGAPVVTTTIGAEGIRGIDGTHYLVADTAADLADAVSRLLEDDDLCARLGAAARQLVEHTYSWEHSANAALHGYAKLLETLPPVDAWEPPRLLTRRDGGERDVDVSVVIPTLGGGELLGRCLQAVRSQATEKSVEILCVDSGSPPADLAMMASHGARIVSIERAQFDHGLTRDLGAAQSRGAVLVFLNQDAVPGDPGWLDALTLPLYAGDGCVAVQGAILEVPEFERRFYWDSCGDRFYFTRETRRWMERYAGLGFSTVNAAIRRDAWERYPFGRAAIMEDKKWQRTVTAAGHEIGVAPKAFVFHTHDYDLGSLTRRCESEGFGWRTLGESYSLGDMLKDMLRPVVYADLARGIASGRVRTAAELFFPIVRPVVLYRGNRWSRGVRL